jgi:hypothetical protein
VQPGALNPADYQAFASLKSTGSGSMPSALLALPETRTAWGVPLTRAIGLRAGTAVVTDRALAATLLWRKGTNIRLSDSDPDAFVRNQVVLLAEASVALATWVLSTIALVRLPS